MLGWRSRVRFYPHGCSILPRVSACEGRWIQSRDQNRPSVSQPAPLRPRRRCCLRRTGVFGKGAGRDIPGRQPSTHRKTQGPKTNPDRSQLFLRGQTHPGREPRGPAAAAADRRQARRAGLSQNAGTCPHSLGEPQPPGSRSLSLPTSADTGSTLLDLSDSSLRQSRSESLPRLSKPGGAGSRPVPIRDRVGGGDARSQLGKGERGRRRSPAVTAPPPLLRLGSTRLAGLPLPGARPLRPSPATRGVRAPGLWEAGRPRASRPLPLLFLRSGQRRQPERAPRLTR